MQIILTKSNNIKFEKQIGHLVLFWVLGLGVLAVRRSVSGGEWCDGQQTFRLH